MINLKFFYLKNNLKSVIPRGSTTLNIKDCGTLSKNAKIHAIVNIRRTRK